MVFENSWSFCLQKGGNYLWYVTFSNVQEARDALRNFEKGEAKILDNEYREWKRDVQEKRREIMIKLQDCIDSHERGNRVYEPNLVVGEKEKPCIQS